MNRRLLTILFIAFVVAAICAFLVYRVVGKRVTVAVPEHATRVVAAATDIKLGTILAANDLSTANIVGPLPQGAILSPSQAIGRGALTNLYQGEPILTSRLAPRGAGGGLPASIPEGMRACAVKVDQVIGVAGFVTPGMRVDVIIAGNPPGASQSSAGIISRTVLQDIKVLSAGTDIQTDAQGKPHQVPVVNLLVTPKQAQILSLASSQQVRILLVLRNPLDTKINKIPVTAMSQLFGSAPAQRIYRSRPSPQVYSIVVYNGAQQTQQKVTPPGGMH
jgi:pilus assembly protein CpaB